MCIVVLTAILCLILLDTPAWSLSSWKPDSATTGFEMAHRYRFEENIPQEHALHWSGSKKHMYFTDIVVSADLAWNSLAAVSIVMDSGEISGDTVDDGWIENDRAEDAFFQQGFLETYFLDSYGIAFKLGQQHIVSGEGYILDDFLMGGQAGFDVKRWINLPLVLYATVAQVRGSSFFYQLKATRPFSSFEDISFSAGWLHDTEGFVADILEEVSLSMYDPTLGGYLGYLTDLYRFVLAGNKDSSSDIVWLVLSAHKVFGLCTLSSLGIFEVGRIQLTVTGPRGRTFRSEAPTLGYLFDVAISRNLSERLSLELFVVVASGEDKPLQELLRGERVDAFVSILPFVTRTNIFFNGGINENLSTREFTVAGFFAQGYCVPGITMTYFFTDDLWVEAKGAFLFSPTPHPAWTDGNIYGWETDLTGYWELGNHVRLSLEADLFKPESFFKQPYSSLPDPAYRIMAGLDILF